MEIDERVDAFLDRPLEGEWPYLWLDATYIKVRRSGRIVSVAAIVAVAVNTDGRREVLGIAIQPSEAEVFWDEFLRALADRGLRGVKLIIADEHKGLKGPPPKCWVLRSSAARALHAQCPGLRRQEGPSHRHGRAQNSLRSTLADSKEHWTKPRLSRRHARRADCAPRKTCWPTRRSRKLLAANTLHQSACLNQRRTNVVYFP